MVERSLMVGCTDFSGADLDELFRHIENWHRDTIDTISLLQKYRTKVQESARQLNRPKSIIDFINEQVRILGNYAKDLDRLRRELPVEVAQRHLTIIQNIYESSSVEERVCVIFSERHIERTLRDESLRPLLGEIYRQARGMLLDYKDLSNLRSALATYLGVSGSGKSPMEKSEEVLTLDPNIYGIGFKIRPAIRWIKAYLKSRKKDRS